MELPARCAARYAVERLLGEGAFGAVLLARDRKLDRPVALKLLQTTRREDLEAVRRFRREAQVAAVIAHPNVVRLLDHDADEGTAWIAYEFVPGMSLHEMAQGQPLPWPRALEITAQVLGGLEAAHARGVLHRDVKPHNVMVAPDGTCKLTDFGLARWNEEATVFTRTGFISGTPRYLAPEVLRGEEPSPAADLYAVGVMLFELLVGEPPFSGSIPQVLEGHVSGPIPRPSTAVRGLPTGVDELVTRALAKDAGTRWRSASAFRLATDAVRAPRETPRPAPASGSLAPRWRGRLIAAAVLIALAGVAAFLPHRQPPQPSAPAPAPLDLAALVQRRVQIEKACDEGRDEEYVRIWNSGATVEEPLPEVRRLIARRRRDYRTAMEGLEALAAEIRMHYPDPARTPPAELRYLAEFAFFHYSHRLRETRLAQLEAGMPRQAGDVLGHLAAFASLAYGPADLTEEDRFLALATALLARATGGDGDAAMIPDCSSWLFWIGDSFAKISWSSAVAAQARQREQRFESDLAALPGPNGPLAGRIASACWALGHMGGSTRSHPVYQKLIADVQELAGKAPEVGGRLEDLLRRTRPPAEVGFENPSH